MKRMVVHAVCILMISAPLLIAANPDYDPRWKAGDTWKVEITSLHIGRPTPAFYRTRQEDIPYPGYGFFEIITTNKNVYTYQVMSIRSNEVTRTADIRITSAESDDLAKIDLSALVVMSFTDLPDSGFFCGNPNPGGPWVEDVSPQRLPMVLPTLPEQSLDQVRPFARSEYAPLTVTQTVHFAENVVETLIVFSSCIMQDYGQPAIRITWEKGKKWWSRATIDVGTNRVATAVLLEQ